MKKIFALFAFIGVLCSISAQKVNETVTMFGKDQLTGFTVNIDNASPEIVAAAMANKFEKEFFMKGSFKKGFHVYESQPCAAFGEARYDTYFATAPVGKKKDQYTQVVLVVSTGNMNCITFANDPRTSRNIVTFLENFPADVEAYNERQPFQELTLFLRENWTMQEKANVRHTSRSCSGQRTWSFLLRATERKCQNITLSSYSADLCSHSA